MTISRIKRSRHSLSLIEVIIATIILILILSTMSFGFIQYHREAAVKTARKEVDVLLRQAEYLSKVTQQNLTVLLKQKGSDWFFILKPWASIPTEKLPVRCVKLTGVSSICLNDREIGSLMFYFTAFKGIEIDSFEVLDNCGRPLKTVTLGLSENKDIIIHMKHKDLKHSCFINLAKYIPHFIHEAIPEDV